ncbi:MAG: exosortase H, partial [Alphaproteobacteria bacterium]|nr:exosortase H [Alphaproteobacteria bacterium]
MLRFLFLFAACLLLLLVELLPPVQEHVIVPFTAGIAHVAAALMHPFDAAVIAQGNELRRGIGGPGIAIVAGCSGVEAVLILVAAVLAFPSPWKHKFAGIVLGFVA